MRLLLVLEELPDSNARTVFTVLREVLTFCSLCTACCIGQAFDGDTNDEFRVQACLDD